VQGFSYSLRKEGQEHGIRVTLVEPGMVGTDMQPETPAEQRVKERKAEMLKAEDIAAGIVYCLRRPRCCVVASWRRCRSSRCGRSIEASSFRLTSSAAHALAPGPPLRATGSAGGLRKRRQPARVRQPPPQPQAGRQDNSPGREPWVPRANTSRGRVSTPHQPAGAPRPNPSASCPPARPPVLFASSQDALRAVDSPFRGMIRVPFLPPFFGLIGSSIMEANNF
jgi:hypothetical protein